MILCGKETNSRKLQTAEVKVPRHYGWLCAANPK